MVAFNVQPDVAFDSFDGLVAGVNEWMDREDLTGNVPQFIALLEDDMIVRLSPLFNETTTSVMATDGQGALPSDLGRIVRVSYRTGQRERFLPQQTASMGFEVLDDTEPSAYSIESGELRLWPQVSATVTIVYQPDLQRLTSTTQTNDLLLKFPSLYFFGALMFANGFVADDQRAVNYKAMYEEAMDRVIRYFTRQKWAGPLVPHRVGLR